MCGICGKVNLEAEGPDHAPLVKAMADMMVHRGPDDRGLYHDPHAAMAHRRLSIIDLNTGKQPISNEDGSIWIVFNGEIYNYRHLRDDLVTRGHRFATATDTEVIVHLYEEYGDECVSRLDGMFAFAIWDRKQRRLLLARDRLGIKPLYYHSTGRHLLFASELKALLVDPECPREIDPIAIDRFLTFRYLPGTLTPFRDIYKLQPGHYLVAANGAITIQQYWDLEFPRVPPRMSFDDARGQLIDLLDATVKAHMISDVPVGVLLSGGVDSSGVLSFATKHAERPIHTFTIGFEDGPLADERPYARIAAEHFGSEHHEVSIGPEEFRDFLPKYVWHMEELVCEPPAVALYFVTRLAHQAGIKVVLSGEGGDEGFAGYNTYRHQLALERIGAWPRPLPHAVAKLAGVAGHLTGQRRLTRVAGDLRTPLRERYFSRTAGPNGYFNGIKTRLYTSDFRASLPPVSNGLTGLFSNVAESSPLAQMLYVDTKTWLPDDLLVKADKMTMANSVELRVPFLDHHVLEFAAALPDDYKIRGQKTKYILKSALSDRVPRALLERKKMGFPVPIQSWLNTKLAGFIQEVLLDSHTLAGGLIRRDGVEVLFSKNSKGRDHSTELFSLLVLELWHRSFAAVNQLGSICLS